VLGVETEIPPEIRRLFPPLKSPVPVEEEERIREHVRRLLSWYVKRAIEEDEDGIVPLDRTFPDNLYDRILRLLEEEWGEERAKRLLDEFYEILGEGLEEWLIFDFFPYHISLYKNRPIFWLLWCGERRGGRKKPYFACFLNYHKLNRDTLYKVRTLYLGRVIQEARIRLENTRAERMETRGSPSKGRRLQREILELEQMLLELEDFDRKLKALTEPLQPPPPAPKRDSWLEEKIREVRINGYNPNIDYGVLVNITPLKEAGVLHREAGRVR